MRHYWHYERCGPEHDPYSNLSPLFLTRNDTSLNYENASTLSLSEELEYVICLNDPSVLVARLSKPDGLAVVSMEGSQENHVCIRIVGGQVYIRVRIKNKAERVLSLKRK
jgi:hypothetical protein